MKKFGLYLLTFALVFTSALAFSACGKKKSKKIEPVDSVVNPIVLEVDNVTVGTRLGEIAISTSAGDTAGTISWANIQAMVILGEREYEWVFVPEDTERYNTATGTITITGVKGVSRVVLTMNSWEYGEAESNPSVKYFDDSVPADKIHVTYTYFDILNDMKELEGKPSKVGEYRIRAKVIIDGLDEQLPFYYEDFNIVENNVEPSEINLSIGNWTYGVSVPPINIDYKFKDYVKYEFSSSENGPFSETVPSARGRYYVKAVLQDCYSGTSNIKEFEIIAGKYPISMNMASWRYGETAIPPIFDGNQDLIDSLQSKMVFSYAEKGSDIFTTLAPTDAGEYKIKVLIPKSEDNNYLATEIISSFSINKAVLTSKSYEGSIDNVEFVEGLKVSTIPLATGWTWDTEDANYNQSLVIGENKRMAIYENKNYSNTIKAEVVINVVDNSNANSLAKLEELLAKPNKPATINVTESFNINKNLEINFNGTISIASGKTITVNANNVLTLGSNVVIAGEGSILNNGSVKVKCLDASAIQTSITKSYVTDIEVVATTDVEFTTLLTVDDNTNVKNIDLGGKKLTNINIIRSHPINISNGTIECASETAITLTGDAESSLSNLTITANIALSVNLNAEVNLTAQNCDFYSNIANNGVILAGEGNYTFTDVCSFKGLNAVLIEGGVVDITSSTFEADAASSGYYVLITASVTNLTFNGDQVFTDSSSYSSYVYVEGENPETVVITVTGSNLTIDMIEGQATVNE